MFDTHWVSWWWDTRSWKRLNEKKTAGRVNGKAMIVIGRGPTNNLLQDWDFYGKFYTQNGLLYDVSHDKFALAAMQR